MRPSNTVLICAALLIFALHTKAQVSQPATPCDGSQVRPPVTPADLQIAKRAAQILNSPKKWNRADNRKCPAGATAFSLYCALEKATDEVSANFEHRGAAMQEARFVIDDIAPNVKKYDHRMMDYNNDPTTTFADLQKVFALLAERIAKRLKQDPTGGCSPSASAGAVGYNNDPAVTFTDLQKLSHLVEDRLVKVGK